MKMEELSRKSFCQNGIISAVNLSDNYYHTPSACLDLFTNDGWSRSIEWEARIPPITQESIKLELHHQFMKNHEYYLECHNRLMGINQDLIELDELLTRCDPQSLEYAKIEMALLQLYHDTSFKQELELYEDLRAKLSTIHQRVSDWECRKADIGSNLSDSQTSLDESHSSSSSSSSASPDIQLPPVPELIPNLFRKTPSITSPSASRADQTMSAMLNRSPSDPSEDFERVRLAAQIWQKELNPDADQFVPRQANNQTPSPTPLSYLQPLSGLQYPTPTFHPGVLQALLARHQYAQHQLQQLYSAAALSAAAGTPTRGILPTPFMTTTNIQQQAPQLLLSHKGGAGKFGGGHRSKHVGQYQQKSQFPSTSLFPAAQLLTGASLAPFPGFFIPSGSAPLSFKPAAFAAYDNKRKHRTRKPSKTPQQSQSKNPTSS